MNEKVSSTDMDMEVEQSSSDCGIPGSLGRLPLSKGSELPGVAVLVAVPGFLRFRVGFHVHTDIA